jgi:hypothetical protein
MFKTIVSYFSLLLFSAYSLSSPIIWATYFVCQDYFAEEFCVNKENPDCCGSCYISDVTDEVPKSALPQIEVRTPNLIPFTIELAYRLSLHQPILLRYPPFIAGLPDPGYTNEILQPPESLLQTI